MEDENRRLKLLATGRGRDRRNCVLLLIGHLFRIAPVQIPWNDYDVAIADGLARNGFHSVQPLI
jgi:hypothetical protein